MEKITTYVAFLRGINVGGNNIIKMKDLKEEFEKMGFSEVKTYIQSGNVIFRSEIKDKEKIEKIIEKALETKLKYKAKVLIRTKKEMQDTISNFPKIFENPEWKHNVIFLRDSINKKEILKEFEIKKEIEEIHYSEGTLFWSAELKSITRSKMLKLSSKKEYQEMTVRNVNTTRKILELMKE